jgi:protein-L-isoaspartate(D-aspartate) O-methyltransferase
MASQYDTFRYNMVNYVKTWEVNDNNILNLMGNISREKFFEKKLSDLSYSDSMIPIGHGQLSLEPKMIARILQNLNLKKTDSVLEIGTGSGYLTTLLSKLTKEVYTIEIIPDIFHKANCSFAEQNIKNIYSENKNGLEGWNELKTFDKIIITGSLNEIPKNLINKLKDNGKMFITIGSKPVMRAKIVTKSKNGLEQENIFDTYIPKMKDKVDQMNNV